MRYHPKPTNTEILIALVVGVILLVGYKLVVAHLAYGDWTCAIAHCTKLKP